MAERRAHESREILATAVSRRSIVRHLVAGAAAGAFLDRGVLTTRAEGTPVATPTGTAGVPGAGEVVAFALRGGVTTHGQFDYPATGAPPYPAVLLIQGSGAIDRHETFVEPDGTVRRPFDLIANELTSRGLAVFRYDKRGVCPPSQVCDQAAYVAQSKPVLTEDAALAYARMIANPLIDARHTAVLGHSEGTWLAPALPDRFPDIRALVLISTGIGVMHALSFSQVTLPLLGVTPYDVDGDGALAPDEVPFADPVAMARFQKRQSTGVQTLRQARQPGMSSMRGRNRRGSVTRDRDGGAMPLLPFLYPERLLQLRRRSGIGCYALVTEGPRVPKACWSEVAGRAERVGLRSVAREFGVSHETVRSICKCVKHKAAMA